MTCAWENQEPSSWQNDTPSGRFKMRKILNEEQAFLKDEWSEQCYAGFSQL